MGYPELSSQTGNKTESYLLYPPTHKQDSTYHGLYYTTCGALAVMRNSSMVHHEGLIRLFNQHISFFCCRLPQHTTHTSTVTRRSSCCGVVLKPAAVSRSTVRSVTSATSNQPGRCASVTTSHSRILNMPLPWEVSTHMQIHICCLICVWDFCCFT